MSAPEERLYALLPAVQRRRDAARGEPLRALLDVLEEQIRALRDDIDGLYRNWFIETCDPWVVPYLGDLLGVRGLQDVEAAGFSLRAYVANTLRYRRRKGTLGVVESLAVDVTGYKARAVEFFQRLDTTQNVNHVRLDHPRTSDLRDPEPLELIGGPLGREVHTAEVRRIDTGRGWYDIPNIGVFLWRLQTFEIEGETARLVPGAPAGFAWYRFDPSGRDIPLFNPGRTEQDVAHLAEEIDLPGPLRSLALAAAVRDLADPEAAGVPWFGENPVLAVYEDGAKVPVGDLRFFHPWQRGDPAIDDWDKIVPDEGKVAVDPARGRLVLHLGSGEAPPSEVTVRYYRAFSAEVGAGPYERPDVLDLLDREPDFQIGVARSLAPVSGEVTATLAEAVDAWNTFAQGRWASGQQPSFGVICLMDSRTYEEDVAIAIPPQGRLIVVAADWPLQADPDAPAPVREKGTVAPGLVRAHLRGTVTVTGAAVAGDPGSRGDVVVDGVQIEGSVTVAPGDLGTLALRHLTIVPDAGGLTVADPSGPTTETGNIGLQVTIDRSICGAVSMPETVPGLSVSTSILASVDAPSTETVIAACTVLGPVAAGTLTASDAIFTGPVTVRRRQTGCVRFSYVPEGSSTPRKFRCQPATALAAAPLEEQDLLRARLVPSFTSSTWGQPGYAQLSGAVPSEIAAGADDGAEMGVFHELMQPQREANLRAALDQYLRVGLDAGVFYVT